DDVEVNGALGGGLHGRPGPGGARVAARQPGDSQGAALRPALYQERVPGHSLLRMRKGCVPTRSAATRTSIRVVTKYPTPSFVVFWADTDSVTASKAMSSPRHRGRAYSCSQSVATTAAQPASSRSRSRSSNASVRPVRDR